MLERIRQSRRLHAVVVTAFALLLLVAMLSGVRVRAATAPATHETLTQSMLHSLCLPQDAPAAAASQQQAYEEWLLSAFDTPLRPTRMTSTQARTACCVWRSCSRLPSACRPLLSGAALPRTVAVAGAVSGCTACPGTTSAPRPSGQFPRSLKKVRVPVTGYAPFFLTSDMHR